MAAEVDRSLACSSDISFVNTVPQEIEVNCNVCLDLMMDPQLSGCCGHHFCLRCLREVQRRQKSCPLCKEPKFTAILNKHLQRTIVNLRVYCPLKSNGCSWQGYVKSLSGHLMEKKREGECPYVTVPCENECGLKVERCRLREHENEVCPKRPSFDPVEVTRKLQQALTMSDQLTARITQLEDTNIDRDKRTAGLEQQLVVAIAEIKLLKTRMAAVEKGGAAVVGPVSVGGVLPALSASPVGAVSTPAMELMLRLPPYEFTFTNYARRCENPELWFCRPFYSHPCGYKICIRVAPQGLGNGEGTHVSIHTYLMKGEYDDQLRWPFKGDVTIQLLNQLGPECHHEQTSFFNDRTPGHYRER